MTKEQRAPYDQMAKLANGAMAKYTSSGKTIDEIELAAERARQEERKMKSTIKNMVKTAIDNGS